MSASPPRPDVPESSTARAGTIALVTGANSGLGRAIVERLLAGGATVYATCRDPENAADLLSTADANPRLQVLSMDVTDSASIEAAAGHLETAGRLDLVINTVGILHQPGGMTPEKKLTDVNFDDLLLAYNVNALGALRLAMALEHLLQSSRAPRFISLSARVGSIGDNRLGGWYAYRASKAALNMLLHTLAIEWGRSMPQISCVALHPGTVATQLSAPFTGNSTHKVFSPEEAAGCLLKVIDELGPAQNGSFFAWDGKEIPW